VDLKHDIFMEVPTGYDNRGIKYILKLLTNMYSLLDALLIWYEHYRKGLTDCSFKLSRIDPNLFYKEGIIIILYVDDTYIFRVSKEVVDKFIQSLKRSNKKSKQKYQYQDISFDFTVKS